MSTKYCIIEPNGQPVFIEVIVEPSIIAGGDFKLINSQNNEVIKNWKITSEYEKPAKIRIHSEPDELHKVIMTWEVLCCSMNPDLFESEIKFKITQNFKQCKLSASIDATRLSIPPCKVKEPDSFSDSVVFIIKRELDK